MTIGIQVFLTVPMKAGDSYPTPFGPQILEQGQIDMQPAGTYVHTVGATRTAAADLAGDAQTIAAREAERIAADLISGPPVQVAVQPLTVDELAAQYTKDELIQAALKATK
jgi:hypothetical protein